MGVQRPLWLRGAFALLLLYSATTTTLLLLLLAPPDSSVNSTSMPAQPSCVTDPAHTNALGRRLLSGGGLHPVRKTHTVASSGHKKDRKEGMSMFPPEYPLSAARGTLSSCHTINTCG